jgi:DNA-directed RNA polymerase alpha subunit
MNEQKYEPPDKLLEDLYKDGRLSVRAYHLVLNDVVKTVGDVAKLSDSQILRIPNIGRRTLVELRLLCGPKMPLSYGKEDPNHKAWVDAVYHGDTDLGFEDWIAKRD